MPPDDKLAKLLEKNIEASNRTTHAVRALVRFLFIQLSFLTAAVVLWQFGLAFPDEENCSILGCEPNGLVTSLVVLLIIAGVVLSSIAGWDELGKSNIDSSENLVSEESRAEIEVKRNAELERERKEALKREAEDRIEQARLEKEIEARRLRAQKLWTERGEKLLELRGKSWFWVTSLFTAVGLIASFLIFFYFGGMSWENKAKECDSIRTGTYSSSNSWERELRLNVAYNPDYSNWLNCLGEKLTASDQTEPLGNLVRRTVESNEIAVIPYGELVVRAENVGGSRYEIVIRPRD